MPKYLMQAEISCGVSYEVEADTEEEARDIMSSAMADHINEGCDGIEVSTIDDNEYLDLGVRRPNHDEPHKLDYYNREEKGEGPS